MQVNAIALLRAVREGNSDPKQLMDIVNLGKTQFYDLVKELIAQDYLEKQDSSIQFKPNAKTILFKDVASRYDVEKMLHDSNEVVFYNLTEPKTLEEIQRITNLSLRTVERAVSELASIGAIKKSEKKDQVIIQLDRTNEPLYLFAQNLKKEYERRQIEEYAEVIYQNHLAVIKKVPKGKLAGGELTGFSLFSDYGIEYHTTHDYYVKQETPLKLEEVLIHAVITAAGKDKDRNAMTMAILFYLKNRDKMNSLDVRSIARRYGVIDIWLDIESFVRGNEMKNADLFSPREEFVEKAQLYDIPADLYTLPTAYPQLFDDIGNNISDETSVYLIGGENMRLKGLKARTKDCDIVVSGEKDFRIIVDALRKKMGYISLNESSLSEDDKRLHASDILVHPARSRMDIFNTTVGELLYISESMKERAKKEKHGNKLELGILQNEDVFLLKGVAGREGDIDDMARLVQAGNFDWNVVWSELENQEKDTKVNFSSILLDTLDYLTERTAIKPPFLKQLVRRVLDKEIFKLIRTREEVSLKEAVESLRFTDTSEKLIRNRIDSLEKKGFLKKVKEGNEVYLEPTGRGALSIAGIPYRKSNLAYKEAVRTVREISNKLGLSEKAKGKAIEVIDRSNEIGLLGSGRSPKTVAAAAVYIASILAGEAHTQSVREIAAAGKVSRKAVYDNYKRIKLYLRY
jgi:transcription initiation factor TFIIIB Brf1 subunit/transcription initiation factor TFIIB